MAETSKKRTGRIPLDYYKRPDGLSWWRMVLSAIAVLVAAGWACGFGWDFWSPSSWIERSRRLASHGTLAKAHATWDSQCEACHVPFQPIGQASWAAPVLGDSSQSNLQCQGCHAAPNHHASQAPQDLACAGCHHDHRGRDASLVQMSDTHCTKCHSDLTEHMTANRTPFVAATVTRFDSNPAHHPEFRSTGRDDPGRLKFDHARHLRPGMATGSETSGTGPIQTLAMLRESDRAQYQSYAQGANGLIQLDCAACHQLHRGETNATATASTTGAYMLPITYQNQCRACHPLDFDPAHPALVMAHPLQPAEVHESLWETYAAKFLKEDPALLDRPIPPRPMPGRAESEEVRKARELIERKVGDAEKILFSDKKCGECHFYEKSTGEPVASLSRWDVDSPVRVAAPNVPAVWWRSASFAHSAHRGVTCRSCHERAYPDSPQASHQGKDVLLPTMSQCVECHSARRRGPEKGSFVGGAGFDCTECHRYHNGDAALLGLAPTSFAPDTRSTIRDFLQGTPATPGP